MREFGSLTIAIVALVFHENMQSGSGVDVAHVRTAAKWLARFKYIDKESINGKSDAELQDVLKGPVRQMRKSYGLGDDDTLDDATLSAMNQPRCGERDDPSTRKKRFTLLGNQKWGTQNGRFPIKIGFNNYLSQFTHAQQETVLMECAKLWSSVSGLSFILVQPPVVPWIRVEYVAMDGPFNTVGQGLSPTPYLNPPNSYLRLDSAEPWALRKSTATPGSSFVSLQSVMCHEMGHNIGLGHSPVRLAIMYPSTGNQPGDAKLDQDDINGVISLYPKTSG